MKAIKTENLEKRFGETIALNGVNLEIEEGELFGLLGVNGAGKTTLIRILSGLTKPTGGAAFVQEKNVLTEMPKIKELIGVSPQETAVALNLTVEENLKFFCAAYGMDKSEAAARIAETEKRFHFGNVMKKKAKTLSGGWQRRLSIAVALISEPKVLFLDEPTLGLDVISRRELWEVIESLKGKLTVILTSHYLEEIEALCDRVAVMSGGKILAEGRVAEIKKEAGETNFEDAFIKIVKRAEGVYENE